jgi:DNA-directed RNA polymerase specialized sigma24 family protein
MTDAEATAAIEVLATERRWKLVRQSRKFLSDRYSDEVADIIHEALLSGWVNRNKIQCMEAYVMRCVHFQAIGWFRRNKKEVQAGLDGFESHSASVQAICLNQDPYAKRLGDNGDSRTAICQWHESQRMEDINSTIDACADMLTPHQRKNLGDLMARDGANGGENHGGSHAVEIRDSRVRRIMRKKRDELESKQKVRRAAA